MMRAVSLLDLAVSAPELHTVGTAEAVSVAVRTPST